MRPLFQGDGCAINEAGISSAGNPLSRAMDAMNGDPLHARQMREGYLSGMRPPMGGPGMMMDPMLGKPGSSLDHAWAEQHMRGPMPMGAAMPEQLRQHMQRQSGADMRDAGFFTDGPMMAEGNWANEFGGGRQRGPRGPGPMMMQRPPGAGPDWAAEFAPGPHGAAALEAAFHQANAFQGAGPMQTGPRPGEMQMMRPMMGGPMPMGLGMMRPPMMGHMGPSMAQMPVRPLMDAGVNQANMEEAFAEAQLNVTAEQDQADLGQAAQMVEMLRNSGNPKFANSQFVSFIDKVSKGDLQFKENTVIDRNGNEVDWDSLYDTDAAMASTADQQRLEKMWQASGGASSSSMDAAWADAAMNKAFQGDPKMEQLWKAAASGAGEAELDQIFRQAAGDGSMEDAWNFAESDVMDKAWMGDDANMESVWTSANRSPKYKFQDENPYLDVDDPLAEAMRLLREGRDREALLCLEAEVRKNPESSEGWRQLGQLYAELDQDVEAIACLRKGHEVDPYNLDSLLALGVSCTNELDQLLALRYLRRWIENHDEHQGLAQNLEMPPEYDYEVWRQQVTTLYNQAAAANPLDANVFIALGVMENINRNYDGAIRALATACRLRPNDHTVWNKLGATLANSGKSEQAVVAYHQGLSLKPNYARSWSNLAIAHANLGQHADAARFYLSSLVLNPDATHIWNFLHSAVLNMNGVNADDMRAIDQRDLDAATKAFDGVLDPQQLPPRAEELAQPAEEILASIGVLDL
mmetsp:Transcript_74311/g.193585  ORF Transcript_74311/g.193585 Transcript_74311/m.193585 type:complete len:750 (-) Transcript_74311:147-2396(-)